MRPCGFLLQKHAWASVHLAGQGETRMMRPRTAYSGTVSLSLLLVLLCSLPWKSNCQSIQPAQSCYWSDGTQTTDEIPLFPCNTTTTGFTHCCLAGAACLGSKSSSLSPIPYH